jgi:hypothetical protein
MNPLSLIQAVLRPVSPVRRYRGRHLSGSSQRTSPGCRKADVILLLDDGSGCPVATRARVWDRLWARLAARRLDADLAAGASPDASVRLALRARTLVRTSVRRDLARSTQRVLAAAVRPSAGPRLPIPVCRDRVRDASGELAELITCLLTPGPVPARGVAKVSVLLGDASGPLYHRGSAQDLRATVRETAEALSPTRAG